LLHRELNLRDEIVEKENGGGQSFMSLECDGLASLYYRENCVHAPI